MLGMIGQYTCSAFDGTWSITALPCFRPPRARAPAARGAAYHPWSIGAAPKHSSQ